MVHPHLDAATVKSILTALKMAWESFKAAQSATKAVGDKLTQSQEDKRIAEIFEAILLGRGNIETLEDWLGEVLHFQDKGHKHADLELVITKLERAIASEQRAISQRFAKRHFPSPFGTGGGGGRKAKKKTTKKKAVKKAGKKKATRKVKKKAAKRGKKKAARRLKKKR